MILFANMVVEYAALLLAGAGLGYLHFWWKERNLRAARAAQQQTTLDAARREAESILREARLTANEEALNLRQQTEQSFSGKRAELQEVEQKLVKREHALNCRMEDLSREEMRLGELKDEYRRQTDILRHQQTDLEELRERCRKELGAIAHLSAAEARTRLLKQIEQEVHQEAANLAHRIIEDARVRAEDKAREIIALAIQRYAGEHTFETTTATLQLQGDDIKGRIIGREGRNIRAFEAATGITVLIDDTPNAVVLSGFDPVRREIAREAMQRLIQDGRIHPTRIEEIVARVSREMDETIVHAGEEAVMKAGVAPMHQEIVKLLGRLKFRHSFSQNILNHSIEVAHLMGLMAGELGLDVESAKRAGLLHDIGKAVIHEVEGTHAIVGAEIVRRCGESDAVVDGVASHHDEVPHVGLLGILVSAADAISASRPGARSETMTTYIKRVEDLERIGLSFPGVEKCYAVQAGRELRVIIQPDQITDDEAYLLARNIARKIENDLQYPGQIRITVTRETRCVEFAK
jgi:ribonuclease Y